MNLFHATNPVFDNAAVFRDAIRTATAAVAREAKARHTLWDVEFEIRTKVARVRLWNRCGHCGSKFNERVLTLTGTAAVAEWRADREQPFTEDTTR